MHPKNFSEKSFNMLVVLPDPFRGIRICILKFSLKNHSICSCCTLTLRQRDNMWGRLWWRRYDSYTITRFFYGMDAENAL